MGLVTCPHCGRQISGLAPACPNCGRPMRANASEPSPADDQPRQGSSCLRTGCLGTIGLVVVAMVLGSLDSSGDGSGTSSSADSGPSASMAYVMCQHFVKQQLRSPGSAKFPGMFDETYSDATRDLGNGSYRVKSWVDAQNGFGALIRNEYTCTITHTGQDNWRLDDLEMKGR